MLFGANGVKRQRDEKSNYSQIKKTVMKITGRVTADAVVRTTKTGKEVVSFSVAINQGYLKDGQYYEATQFINCSYWLDTAAANDLTKGVQVDLAGRIGIDAYMKDGQPKASITLNVSAYSIKANPNAAYQQSADETIAATQDLTPAMLTEDLPF
jgi:single-strand DNA-binding protein